MPTVLSFGGIALGLAIGYVTYRLLKSLDSYHEEVLITLAAVVGGYALASRLQQEPRRIQPGEPRKFRYSNHVSAITMTSSPVIAISIGECVKVKRYSWYRMNRPKMPIAAG